MAIQFWQSAIKFLRKANPDDVVHIQTAIKELVLAVEEIKSVPFERLDIKKMNGQWQGFYRLLVIFECFS